MSKLFSYVVDHDYGFAPNPQGGFCSLAKCKYGSAWKRNIVELAEVGDWIAGTGGVNLDISAGHGKLNYAMRVDRKIALENYCRDFARRIDAGHEPDARGRFALMSDHFFYFGRNALDISEIPDEHLAHRFEKSGPGYRCDFSAEFVDAFARWLSATFEVGRHGPPCKPHSMLRVPACPPRVKRKRRDA